MAGSPGVVSYISSNPDQGFNPDEMEFLCVAVLYNDRVYFFDEGEIDRLLDLLNGLKMVVGVNELFLDILEKYGEPSFRYIGIQGLVSEELGERVSLANTARKTLGLERPEIAALPLEWREGHRGFVRRELKEDVLLIRELYQYINERGYVHITKPGSLEETTIDVSI